MYEFMLVTSVVIFFWISGTYAMHPAASVLHPQTFYLLFHGVVFVVRPIFAWYYNFNGLYAAIQFDPTPWQKTTVLICTNIALVVFSGVCMAIARDPIRYGQSSAELAKRGPLLRNFWIFALIIGALGMWAVFSGLQFKSTGNIDDIRKVDARTGATYLTGASGYFISLPFMLSSLTAIIVYLGRHRWWSYLPFAIFALLKLGTGGRGGVVAAAVMIIMLYLFDKRRRWPGVGLLLAVAAGWMIFDQVGTDRGAGIREALGYQSGDRAYIRERSQELPLESMDLANMEFFEYLVWAIPQRTGSYDYFVSNLQLFTEPIPRALWPEKPVGAPIKMYELYRYAIPLGATASVPGVGWASAGYVGVVIWSAFFAFIYGGVYRWFVRSEGSNVAVLAYIVFVSTSVVGFRDGGLMTILKQLQFFFVPIGALWIVSHLLNKRHLDFRSFKDVSGLRSKVRPLRTGKERRLAAMSQAQVGSSDRPPTSAAFAASRDTPKDRRIARMQLSSSTSKLTE
ncbi:O-antigen polymerase [Croceibacterium mercuriale]|uniref:O-antigen polymerase n=1 Tax=Croceibacterium mercuriale TaxID=1572751 RepID=UPI0012699F79|nr:O-antigen polymerase [Croceibacterium mercuriale]